jgi:prepilin signal peptidase PulO-like enzyme (type II secretory pathway)
MPPDGASADAFSPDAPSARPDGSRVGARIAQVLSAVVNPLVLPPLLFGLVLAHLGAPLTEIGWAMSVGLVFFAVLPLAYVVRMLRAHRTKSLDIPERTRRWRPLLVSVGAYLVALGVLYATTQTAAVLLAILAGLHAANTLLILVVTLRWKISIHTAALGGFVSMLLFVAQTPWPSLVLEEALLSPLAVSGLLVLLVALLWARVRLGAHTLGQAAGGALFGLTLPYAELSMLAAGGFV